MFSEILEKCRLIHWRWSIERASVVVVLLQFYFDWRRNGWYRWVSVDRHDLVLPTAEFDKLDSDWAAQKSEEALVLRRVVRFADACKKLDVGVDQFPTHTIDNLYLHQLVGQKVDRNA